MGMTDPDVVAELRHWLNQGITPPLQVIERARDEIVALRGGRLLVSQGLEAAAQLCEAQRIFSDALDPIEMGFNRICEGFAMAIRALKAAP